MRGRDPVSYVVSWSGGKDSCFACYEAMNKGYDVSYLMNFISDKDRKVRSHGIGADLIRIQAAAIGLPLLQRETSRDRYEQELKEAVRSLNHLCVKGMIFGDIYIQEHKDWVERVCGELGIEAVEPLWGRDPEKLLLDFIDARFEAVIVSAKRTLVGREWIGQKVGPKFLRYLKEENIDICGEHGEYHTLVTYGPIFKKKLRIHRSKTTIQDDHWFLDILECSM